MATATVRPGGGLPDTIQGTLTPGLFGTTVSEGQYKLPPHIAHLDRVVTETVARGNGRLLVTMPPQHGKSEYISKYLPAWFLGTYPDRRVLLASYQAQFAATWGRKARNLLMEAGHLFGVQVDERQRAADQWDLLERDGGMSTAGISGGFTGRGAHLFVIDDPIKNEQEAFSARQRERVWDFYRATAYTRLRPDATVIILHTRWHRDDLIGRLLAGHDDTDAEAWRVVNLRALAEGDDPLDREPQAALWPQQYPRARLEKTRQAIGPYYWQALYQQHPPDQVGSEWPGHYFAGEELWFDEWPPLRLRAIALDPSKSQKATADYSAFVAVGLGFDGNLYVDADLERRDVAAIVDRGMQLLQWFRPDGFRCEVNQFQQLVEDMVVRAADELGLLVPTYPVTNTDNKHLRIRKLSPYLAQGKLRFKRGSSGCKLLIQQLRDFPNAAHDDGPDGLEMAISLLRELAHAALEDPETDEQRASV